jgi:hypothetical protein
MLLSASSCILNRRTAESRSACGKEPQMKSPRERLQQEDGAIGYIALWILGVPASVLFVIFLLRGCT